MGPPSQHVSKIIPHRRQCSFARISCVSPPQIGHIDCVEFGINFQKWVCCKRLIVTEFCPENIQTKYSRHSSSWFSRLFSPSHPRRNMKIHLIELLEFVYLELFHSTLSKSIIILYISAKHEIGANFKTAVVTNHDDILECKICLVNVWNNYESIHSFSSLRYY